MRRLPLLLVVALLLAGCAQSVWFRPPAAAPLVTLSNPMLVPVADREALWDGLVDVLGDYFRIAGEEPVRLLGNTLTEGRIDTFPKTGATLLEPWDQDSANAYERLESTLQTIRRRAVVRVIPAPAGGFWIDLAVFKELENLRQPEHSTAGGSTFRFDTTQTRIINPEHRASLELGWIPMGRDTALEQRILAQLQYRLAPEGQPVALH